MPLAVALLFSGLESVGTIAGKCFVKVISDHRSVPASRPSPFFGLAPRDGKPKEGSTWTSTKTPSTD